MGLLYEAHNFDKGMDDDKGTTRVLAILERLINSPAVIQMYGMIKYKAVPSDKLLVGSKEMFESVQMNPRRHFLKMLKYPQVQNF